MGAIFLIVFRESLEAAIVVGIVGAFLAKSGLARLSSAIWTGGLLALGSSLGIAALFLRLLGQFEGRAEQLFEGTVMLVGAAFITTLVVWIGGGKGHKTLEVKASAGATWWSIAILVFASILREGVETVIFLGSSLRNSGPGGAAAGLAGLATAAALGYAAFAAGAKLRGFFKVTNVLLLLFAAGLLSRAAGEYVEAGILPPLVERLWDLNPAVPAGGSYPLLHEDGAIGSIFKGLFGYSGSPSLAMLLAYCLYVAGIGAVLVARRRAHSPHSGPGSTA